MNNSRVKSRHVMPTSGQPWSVLQEQLIELKHRDVDWQRGRAAVFVHYAGHEALDVAKKAYALYFSENGLGKRAFPSLDKLERDVVDMGLALLQGGPKADGFMTTGGTESIFMAVKAARDLFRETHGPDGVAQIVLPVSAHPAFDKAAHFLGLKTIRTPLNDDFCADPKAMEKALTDNTAMIVGSAPAYPHGVIDPIEKIASLASRHKIWMHVDACVGGYFAPFVRMLGHNLPAFDFSVAGVSSISADLHKYGYAAKGASTLFFADKSLATYAEYSFENWPRGTYHTQTLVGTRPGGAIAAAWAVMHHLGIEGYMRVAREIILCRQALEHGLQSMGLSIWGKPMLSIMAWGSESLDIAQIGQGLSQRGWLVGYLNQPPGIHLMLNATHLDRVNEYLNDVQASLQEAGSHPSSNKGSPGVVY